MTKTVNQTIKIPISRPLWDENVEHNIKDILKLDAVQRSNKIPKMWKKWKIDNPNEPWNACEWKSCLSSVMSQIGRHYNGRVADFVKQIECGGRTSVLGSFGYAIPEGFPNILPTCVKQGIGNKIKSNTANVWKGDKKPPYSKCNFVRVDGSAPFKFSCTDGRHVVRNIPIGAFERNNKGKVKLSELPKPNAGKKRKIVERSFILNLGSRIKNKKQWDNSFECRLVTGVIESHCCEIIKNSKGKYFISFGVKVEVSQSASDKVAGMDLGIKYPVVIAGENKDKLTVRGNEYMHMKRQKYRRMQQVKRQNRFSRTGHGSKNKQKPITKMTEKYQCRYKKWIERIASETVKWLKRNNYGMLIAEDLSSDISEGKQIRYPFRQLHAQIDWCCQKNGIKFVTVNPHYTSRRCSKCGHINNEFTKPYRVKNNLPGFICSVCNFGKEKYVDADFNAACNIRTPDVEKIIKKQLVSQKVVVKSSLIEEHELNLDALDVLKV